MKPTVLSPEGVRCTQATLEALGVFGECPKHGTGVLEAIRRAGYGYDIPAAHSYQVTIAEAIRHFPRGRYYLSGNGHAMALVDGVLTDTAAGGMRRRVDVYEVTGA